ncbi:EF-hand calcium-binding domain-containing protein 12-like [Haliotis rubra]|uniref:EF-hand calcium-binding domain-containing protein 12-like n=1 Tax=Haliotis rubra TaxID=36100 RepID=UPI001EE61325|nr:EF-hand calcium-binding domain-containing protein 12-like [Haliotis rubra]
MPPSQRSAPDLLDHTDVSFSLERLFDHYNMDHIPEGKRLDGFQQRDLRHVKGYKAAVRIFGGPLSRKRIIVAPPMETPMKHRLGIYQNRKSPPSAVTLNSELQPQTPPEIKPSEEEVEAQKEREKCDEYQKWISDRKKLRQDLNSIGLNDKWLQGKAQKTVLETRVMNRMKDEKSVKPGEPVIKEPRRSTLTQAPPVPVMKIPSPHGLQILDEHLHKKRVRLLDLFRLVDKDKNWAVSKDEFAKCIEEAQLDITEKELEDMVISLDSDLTDEVDYSELAKGMLRWKKERREKKREQMSQNSGSSSNRSRSGSPATSRGGRSPSSSSKNSHRIQGDVTMGQQPVDRAIERTMTAEGRPTSNRSSNSSERSRGGASTPQYLEPPPGDTRLEQMILSSEEAMVDLRKHDHVVLARSHSKRKSSGSKRDSSVSPSPPSSVIKIGHKAIDNHSLVSTLGGEVGEMVNRFRQLRLKEYYDVVRMCEEKGVPLTQPVLERVLLYPPDLPPGSIKRRVSQPGQKLLSTRFATSPKPPRAPLEVRHKDKMKRSKSGQLMIDSRHIYPRGSNVTQSVSRETLSTGRALISRKIDCWMSFEEYEDLTSHLAVRYKQLHGNVDNNAFWPGHLLNKLRLCMPTPNDGSQAVFYNTKQQKRSNPGYHNDLQTWPVGPEGHVMYAPYERYYRNP